MDSIVETKVGIHAMSTQCNAGRGFLRSACWVALTLVVAYASGCRARSDDSVSLRPITRTNSPDVSVQTQASDDRVVPSNSSPKTNLLNGFSQRVFEAQLCLIRAGISPGSIDGLLGPQTRAGIRAFQEREELPVTGTLNRATLDGLTSSSPAIVSFTITKEDLARLHPLGQTWLEKSQQERLDFETILELIAEKNQAHPDLIRKLNPGIDWDNVAGGTSVYVPNAEFPSVADKAAFVRISLGDRVLEAFDESTNLLVHFPCSIAQRVEKRPVGE